MENTHLSMEEIKDYCCRLSGKNAFGDSKALVAYQAFAAEEPEDSRDKQTIYTISKATVDMSYCINVPGYLKVDIIFNAYDDTELKLLWGRLQRAKKNEQEQPDKMWIFHFNIMERASISDDTEVNDTVFIAHVINPYMVYLTRETPTTVAEDRLVKGELLGGNVIRMLIPVELVQFESSDQYNTSEIKGEAEREKEASDYIDNYEPPVDDGENW